MNNTDLIARLEATEEGSRELDRNISAATNGALVDGPRGATWPHYSTSLDAALTLVPEGLAYGTGWALHPHGHGWAWIQVHGNAPMREAATPALALCIAALKALNGG